MPFAYVFSLARPDTSHCACPLNALILLPIQRPVCDEGHDDKGLLAESDERGRRLPRRYGGLLESPFWHRFRCNEVRLALSLLAYNLAGSGSQRCWAGSRCCIDIVVLQLVGVIGGATKTVSTGRFALRVRIADR